MYLEGILKYIKYKNIFLIINRCILKNTKVFECFSMLLGVFIIYFIVLVVYFNVFQCIYSIFQYILIYLNRVVILGIRRLTGERSKRARGLAHYTGRELGVLDIFSEYSLKIPRIYLNMLKYSRIYSNILEYTQIFPCRAGAEVYQARQAGRRTDNPVFESILVYLNIYLNIFIIYLNVYHMYLWYIYGVFDVFIVYLNIFECIWKYLEYISMYLKVFEYIWMYLNVLISIFKCTYNLFQCIQMYS
jgi:hypothetical protein